MTASEPRVRTVTAQDCLTGIAAAHERLEALGTTEAEVLRNGSVCHHEQVEVDALRSWRFLLYGAESLS